MNKDNSGIVQLVLAEFFIAFSYILVRLGNSLGNENLAFFRVLFGAVFILILSIFYRKFKISKFKAERGKLVLFGALHGFIILASFISSNLLTISSAVIIQSTIGMFTAFFAIILLKEKIRLRFLVAVLISFMGMIALINPQTLFLEKNILGVGAALFVGFFGGFVYVFSKMFKEHDKISLTFWQNLIAAPFLLPLLFYNLPKLSAFSFSIFIGLGFFGALSFVLLYIGLGKVNTQRASALTLLYVVFSIILAMIFFFEIPTSREIIGGILIGFGSYLAAKK